MFRIVLFLSLIALPAISFSHPVYQKGMSYTPWSANTLLQDGSRESIADMRNVGVEWVALTVFWFQDDATSTVIEEDLNRYSASRASVEQGIADLKAQGIKVMLKPHVDLRSGDWRGTIVPSEAWFVAYEEYIVDWARVAAEHDVDLFCIGCELVLTAQGSQWADAWRQIATRVREVYDGPLTYASNHGNEEQIEWWDAVDYIGIDAYYPLSNTSTPIPRQLRSAWMRIANTIETWLDESWPDKPVLFTEIGYRSWDGANVRPWEFSGGGADEVDLQEQVDCYEAVLGVMQEREWFWGFYWWNWETNPNAGGPSDPGYTPQGKPVAETIRLWYQEILTGGRFDSGNAVQEWEALP